MPELPEVETIKRELTPKIVLKTIKKVIVLRIKSFKGKEKDIEGKKILGLGRKAKILIIKLTKAYYLLIHLKMSGQLIYKNKLLSPAQADKHDRVIIQFTDNTSLIFNDLRIFGWMKIIKNLELKIYNEKFGPEPLSSGFTAGYLKGILSKSRKAIKLVIMDQEKVAGIGNIYANEILFEAGINPLRPANSLTEKEIDNLQIATVGILNKAIKYKGSSAKDDRYRRPNGDQGSYQNHFRVYQSEGEKCFICGQKILRTKQAGRSTFYCPVCQK